MDEDPTQPGNGDIRGFRRMFTDPSRRLPLIAGVVSLVLGLVIGAFAMYLYAVPTREALEWNQSQLSTQKKNVSDLKGRVQELTGENSKLSDQIKELTPTASVGTNGLTILSRNLKTQDETQMVDYVVRNDADKTLDEISLDFRYLDKDGNSVGNTSMGNNAKVEPGKTGTVTAYVQMDREQYPAAVKIQAQQGYATVNGTEYQVQIPDDPGVNF